MCLIDKIRKKYKYDLINFNWSFIRPVFQYNLYSEPDNESGRRSLAVVGKSSICLYDPDFDGIHFSL